MITWNILADAYCDASKYPDALPELVQTGARSASIIRLLNQMFASEGADVICLQEVERSLMEDLRVPPECARPLWAGRTPSSEDGCAVIVREPWSVSEFDVLRYRSASDHMAQRFVVRAHASSVAAYNTHFRWSPDDGATASKQAAELIALCAADPAVIVAGDLNAPPESAALAAFAEARLLDVHDDATLRTARFPGVGSVRVDYVLTRALQARPKSIGLKMPPEGTALPSWSIPSDHVPVAATISVPPRDALRPAD
jgi:endonuclease/exonuclease/phosphatase family metal-dependent hydrolase